MPGWKLFSIDGNLVKDSQDAWSRLQEAQWQWRTTAVTFVTDFRAIRVEEHMIRAEEEKTEVERLAKLPFAGTYDERHLKQIKEEFSLQGYNERVEDRAITIKQLQRVIDWAKDRCHRWRDNAQPNISRTSGRKLHLEFMNMCHLHDWLISPATKEKDCSLVEMLTSQKQPPAWYVCHWWPDLLVNLIACLKTHTKARGMDKETTSFWIASCATRPHSPQDPAFSSDPKSTRFYKAMSAANFKVLLCLDPKMEHSGAATCLTRLWCCYELSMCLDTPTTVLDLVHCPTPGGKGSMVTQHLTQEEKDAELLSIGSGYKAKSDREKSFSLNIMESALNVQVQMAQTCDPLERQKMLNSIAQRDLAEQPLDRHDLYSKASRRLSALFALAFWRRTMCGSASDTEMQRLQMRLIDALRSDTSLQSLDLSLCEMGGGPEKLKLLGGGLPSSLKELRLDIRQSDLPNESIAQLAAGLPRELEDLTLDLSGNEQLSTSGFEVFMTKLPAKLRSLTTELEKTNVGKQVKAMKGNLEGIKQHFADEAAKADRCIIVNLCPCPAGGGRMIMSVSKTKLTPTA